MNKNKNSKISFSSSLAVGFLILSACAHHNDVRPSSDGVHRVILKTEDKDEGFREGMSQARHYCKESGNRSPVVMSEESKYTGSMNESNYKAGKTAAKIAQAAGGAAYVFGGKNEKSAGGIVGLGGGIAKEAIGEGYSFEMKFKCE